MNKILPTFQQNGGSEKFEYKFKALSCPSQKCENTIWKIQKMIAILGLTRGILTVNNSGSVDKNFWLNLHKIAKTLT